MRCGCVCLGSGFGCAPPFLAGVLGRACLCARSACTSPLLAWVCAVGVCAWARVSAALRHSWLGCWGFVCVGVLAPLVPRHSWLGCAVWVCVLGLRSRLRPANPGWVVGVYVFVCALRLYPATPGWGLWCVGSVLPGTCSCALVRCLLCALLGFAAPGGRCCLAPVRVPCLWPAACPSGVPRGPALMRSDSSGPVALGAPVGFPNAMVPFPIPGAVAPGFTGRLRRAPGGGPRTGLFVPAAGPRRGRGAGLAPRHTLSGPHDGVVPGGSLQRRSWAACAALVCVCGPGH